MFEGIIAGITWAFETIILGVALNEAPFISTEQAVVLAPFVSTFIHDAFSAVWACIYNLVRGNLGDFFKAIKTKGGLFVALAAIIGGPIGMTGYVLTINNMGPSIGAIASAIFPAVGAVLAYFFLKEKMQWYRWVFLLLTLLGVYGLSYSPEVNINNFALGLLGTLMCSFGWGIEAVILAKCMQDSSITDEIALQIRQTTSALTYGLIILPNIKSWNFTLNIFNGNTKLILTIALAALFATVSYLFYYRAISKIGASKAMALNVSYAAWSIPLTVLFFKDTSVLNPVTIACCLVVLVCGVLAAADYKDFVKK